ncbi:MAG: C25 family cysteine peptidase [candidate division KSB1 bacterium]|nr:C25 family cysteine peptidase [candidate division KSB1 bacterium]MDZ7275505.1 C25 family cysteine peptidase [candidate division KSB1 bacterium]MDZ7286183.1 C25 family cysteine peptidase [candidate division KSB1 bacterium]MDZ7296409.1 C25 family cysteine peptidase [candidate division KSB1 bacterium]MDZ7347276.1 C25 family cysteine peptidase [candidate division KSB1 bacterium]
MMAVSMPASLPAQPVVRENSTERLRLHVTIPAPQFSQQNIAGESFDLVTLPGFVLQHQPGWPALPVQSFTLILPPVGEPLLEVVTTPGPVFTGKRLLPSLATVIDAGGETVRHAASARHTTAWPVARLAGQAWWRGFRLARLEIVPLRLAGERLEFFSEVQVMLRFPAVAQSVLSESLPLTEFENRVLAPLVNFTVGRQWRSRPLRTVAAAEWDLPGEAGALKLAVKQDALYHLSFEYLVAAGWRAGAIVSDRLQLFHRGRELPLLVQDDGDSLLEAGEALLFFGRRPAGEASYFDDFTDTNIYWLVQGNKPGMRMASRTVGAGTGTPGNFFLTTRHFEEDLLYYHGDNDAQLYATLTIPGETWIWQMLPGNGVFQTDLLLQNVATNAPACTLRGRLRGVTVDPANPDHHSQFWLNGTLLGEVFYNNNEEVLFSVAFPSHVLREGKNAFELRELQDTGARYDQIYLDWLEVSYWRTYVASDHFLNFRAPAGVNRGLARYQITNLHDEDILLFDRPSLQLLTGFPVQAAGPGQFVVTFADSVRPGREYFIATAAARQRPAAILANQPSQLRASGNSAEYLIITHAEFLAAAERLAAYRRQHDGLAVAVIDVTDIYDEFNFGIAHPAAIRRFLQHAYEHWQPPRPAVVCFLGDASWDPKQNARDSFKRDFVPSFGNPVSDSRLVCFDGDEDFLPELITGRLAVENLEQAHAVIDKIIAQESSPPAEWDKTFIFLNGGVDSFEQEWFQSQSEALISRHVLADPIRGRAVRLYKTTPGRLLGELKPQIVSALEAGATMLTFQGHAGSQTWDLMMTNADLGELRNRGRHPFIASMTCHTARFATPNQTSFGEEFLRLPEGGTTAFWGTTGWGFIFQDRVLLDSLFMAFSRDGVRRLGEATTLARLRLWQAFGSLVNTVNSIDQYTLLGDPATPLTLPRQPDLVLPSPALAVTPELPTEQTMQVKITLRVRNYGLATADSVPVTLTATSRNDSETIVLAQALLPPLGFADSIEVRWMGAGRRGEYVIRAEIDPANRIAEANEFNNSSTMTLYFSPVTATPAAPRSAALVNQRQPTLMVYNPAGKAAGQQQVQFEIDSSAGFSSAGKMMSALLPAGEMRTSWQVPTALVDGLYFWRSRGFDHGLPGVWQTQWFWLAGQSPFAGMRQSGEQLQTGVFLNTRLTIDGVGLALEATRALNLQVQSAGHDDGNYCYLIVNFHLINADGRGHNVAAIDPATQQLLAPPRVHDTHASSAAADSLAAFLEGLPLRTLVLAGIQDDGSFRMTERAHRALAGIGSKLSRRVGLRDSWAIIGAKGLPVGAAVEMHKPAGTGAAAVDTTMLPFFRRGIYHSQEIGPAQSWRHVEWYGASTDTAGLGMALQLALSGRQNHSTAWQPLATGLTGGKFSLAGISAAQYPYLRLSATLSDDDGLDSPVLRGWSAGFERAPDLAVSADFLRLSADTLQEGETVTITAKVFNFKLDAATPAGGGSQKCALRFAHADPQGERAQRTITTLLVTLREEEAREFATTWNTAGQRGLVTLYVEVDPDNLLAEPFEFNNLAARQIFVTTDARPPRLQVTFDGVEIMDGDYVSAQPGIVCTVFDDSALPITDSSHVTVYLDDQRMAYRSGVLTFLPVPPGTPAKATVMFLPQLQPGVHHLRIEARDATGNAAAFQIQMRVDDALHLSEVMNYPNPFANATEFTYHLTQPAQQVIIKIYTVAGRLIASLGSAPAHAGFNRLAWDGRDADGDRLANGVYFYKIIAESGAARDEVVQKFVVMR